MSHINFLYEKAKRNLDRLNLEKPTNKTQGATSTTINQKKKTKSSPCMIIIIIMGKQ